MCLKMIIYDSDERMHYISEYISGVKHRVSGESDQEIKIGKVDIAVLPTPLARFKATDGNAKKLKQYLINNRPMVFAGAINESWKNFFDAYNIEYFDLMNDEMTAIQNAEITAEATIMLYVQNSKYSINDEKIIVSGYGRCGRLIAKKFGALGAKVTVLDRKKEIRKLAAMDGYNAVDFAYGPQEAYGSRVIINTVPATVIGDVVLQEVQGDTLLIEIASKPGGFDLDSVARYGLEYVEAPGIPSKYMQRAGGRVLANCIVREIKSRFNDRVEEVWIYQASP